MGPTPPRILVLQHHKENPKKCTVTPIRGRPDVEVRVLRPGPSGYPSLQIGRGILLAVGAPPLSREDRPLLEQGGRLVVIDANWVKVPRLLRCLHPEEILVPRSLGAEIRTAYPRRSKVFQDPPEGLATVEAIAAALAILGLPDPSILDGYVWKERFLEMNRGLFVDKMIL